MASSPGRLVSRKVIADAGPLIALTRIGEIDLLRRLYGRVVVPPAVHTELAIDSNRPGAKALAGVFAAGWVAVATAMTSRVRWELDQLLGPGEAATSRGPIPARAGEPL